MILCNKILGQLINTFSLIQVLCGQNVFSHLIQIVTLKKNSLCFVSKRVKGFKIFFYRPLMIATDHLKNLRAVALGFVCEYSVDVIRNRSISSLFKALLLMGAKIKYSYVLIRDLTKT